MRIVPQILRHWLVMNTIRSTSMENMMDHCDGYPQLLHCKRMLLHDLEFGKRLVEDTIDEVAEGRFSFRYRSRKELGRNWNPMLLWEEDCAETRWTQWDLIRALRELRGWMDHQQEYRYPSEIYPDIR